MKKLLISPIMRSLLGLGIAPGRSHTNYRGASCLSLSCCLLLLGGALGAPSSGKDPQPPSSVNSSSSGVEQFDVLFERIPTEQHEGARFLIQHMPNVDRNRLSPEFLQEHVELAYEAREHSPWGSRVPDALFINYVLPYVNLTENRDSWRENLYRRYSPLFKETKTPTEAAVRLNQTLFKDLGVRYGTDRPKADQSPQESIEAGTASCTGLSILLVDACRSIGIPARVVGTAQWANTPGNHTWVEIWDEGWHYTGAAEPTDNRLNEAWFAERAANASPHPHPTAIYAVSYAKTDIPFPMVWDPKTKWVNAIDVTAYYARKPESPKD